MKKPTTILLALLAISIVSASVVFAFGPRFATRYGNQTNYQDMQNIMVNGTYSDLVDYRQTTGFNVMPWVDDEGDFELAQQMHSKMNAWRQSNNVPKNQGFGRSGGCPMRNSGGWN